MIHRPRPKQLRGWLSTIDRFRIASDQYVRHSDVAHMTELCGRFGQLEIATAATRRQCGWGAHVEGSHSTPARSTGEQLQLDALEVLLRVRAAAETAGVLTRDDPSHWNAAELFRRNELLTVAVEQLRSGPALGSSELAWLMEFSTRYVAMLADGGQLPVLDPADRTPSGRLRVRVARGLFFAAQVQGPENNLREPACTARVGQ
jgi:hypothetical protein